MEITLTPELVSRIERLATEQGRPASQVVEDIVVGHLDHDAWFRQQVQRGLDALDRGEFVSQEEVGQRIERLLQAE
jgi:predicted transcriptional regulator